MINYIFLLTILIAAPQQQGVVPAGTGNPYQRANQLPARIIDLKVEPATVRAGQTVTLIWATENQNGITIEPEIGSVFQARGSRQITPNATTTYKMTVKGPMDQVLTREEAGRSHPMRQRRTR